MGNVQNRSIHRQREWVPGFQGLGQRDEGAVTADGDTVSFSYDKNVLELEMMVAPHHEYVKNE